MSLNETKANDILDDICNQTSLLNIVHKNEQFSKIYDPFDVPDIEDDRQHKKEVVRKKNIMICVDCAGEMFQSPRGFECESCGQIEENNGNEVETISSENGSSDMLSSYNTSSSSATPVRISGPGSVLFQRKMVGNISNYKKTQKKTTNDQMTNVVYQFKGPTPPKYVVSEAVELYYSIQQHCIKRGDVRKGTMAACLYRVCKSHDIDRKPKEIADIFGILQSELSNGEKILDDLAAKGLIQIKESRHGDRPLAEQNNQTIPSVDQEDKQMQAFLKRYFEILNIPLDEEGFQPIERPNYKEFACKLIKFTIKYHIADSSITSSRCAGAIYILSSRRKELHLKRDVIEKSCAISKSTFGRFSIAVANILTSTDPLYRKVRSRLRNLFKKYEISVY